MLTWLLPQIKYLCLWINYPDSPNWAAPVRGCVREHYTLPFTFMYIIICTRMRDSQEAQSDHSSLLGQFLLSLPQLLHLTLFYKYSWKLLSIFRQPTLHQQKDYSLLYCDLEPKSQCLWDVPVYTVPTPIYYNFSPIPGAPLSSSFSRAELPRWRSTSISFTCSLYSLWFLIYVLENVIKPDLTGQTMVICFFCWLQMWLLGYLSANSFFSSLWATLGF